MAAMRLAIKGKTPDEIRAMTKEKLNLPTTLEDFMAVEALLAKIGATTMIKSFKKKRYEYVQDPRWQLQLKRSTK